MARERITPWGMHLRGMVIAMDWMRHMEANIKDNVKGFTWRIQRKLSLAEMDNSGAVGMGKQVGI